MTRAMKLGRAGLGVALVLALMAPASAAEAKRKRAPECGGKWVSADDCVLRYAGGGLAIDGFFRAGDGGFVSVTLETIDPTTGARIPVLACGSFGRPSGACGAFATESPTVELERGQKLFCTVQGAERGTYGCANTP